ncbi:tryptophan synthase subunit alpha [Candidatus Nitronereus thalassa]|uniref:Tryptophan synthase alpha chain n=1 Tax=Candidatus Nitronereus thalassa TaxID=3020898 RepID=A0ABU3K4N6_9BACT|nr:tryptophan synthase subunit alpha [Candidatus Nitronereus thalassa]MDT7041346.1 tryptophan synthase subunit alpha [Candidatus Nitronereus thalassa]
MLATANRISATFEQLAAKGEKALIPYIMAGDPSLADTESLVLALEKAGADLIELGVPFSDPIADGPVIQKAAERALLSGTSLRRILAMVKTLRTKTQIPLILMTYYNTIMAIGEETFCQEAVAAGVDGVIVPDMPPEEADNLHKAAQAHGPCLIYLLAPTSTSNRKTEVIRRTQGFIYYVSITGITGAKLEGFADIEKNVRALQKKAKKPIAVGFGIATPDDARRMAAFADGVIVGSALVKKIAEFQQSPELIQEVSRFTEQLKSAIRPNDRAA